MQKRRGISRRPLRMHIVHFWCHPTNMAFPNDEGVLKPSSWMGLNRMSKIHVSSDGAPFHRIRCSSSQATIACDELFYFFTPHPIMPGRPLDSKKEWQSAQAPSLRLAVAAAFLRSGGNGRRHASLKFRPLARESSLKLVAPIFIFRPVRPFLHKAVFHLSEQLRTQIFKMREITAFRTDL